MVEASCAIANMNVTGVYWWSVNIGSGNGLVPSGNKPLPNDDPDLCHHMVSLDQNELIGVIVLVLQDIHHYNCILQHQLNVDRIWEQNEIHAILIHTELFLYIIIHNHLDNMMW